MKKVKTEEWMFNQTLVSYSRPRGVSTNLIPYRILVLNEITKDQNVGNNYFFALMDFRLTSKCYSFNVSVSLGIPVLPVGDTTYRPGNQAPEEVVYPAGLPVVSKSHNGQIRAHTDR